MGPILIGGVGRSGTTLMMAMLDSHPDLCILPELHCWNGDSLRTQIEANNKQLFARLQRAAIDVDTAVNYPKRFPRWEGLTFESRCNFVLNVVSNSHQIPHVPVWGMKIMNDIRRADEFLSVWPEARFILMLRDPRDCYASQKQYGQMGKDGPEGSARSWNNTLEAFHKFQEKHPDNGVIVKYEYLVDQPEMTMARLLSWLEVHWSKNVLEHNRHPHILTEHDDVSHYSREQIKLPINRYSVSRWERDLTDEEVVEIEVEAARLMKKWGYECSM